MTRKCCNTQRWSGLDYCKNDANVSLFLRGFTYEDFVDTCNKTRYCIEYEDEEFISDQKEDLVFFFSPTNPRLQQVHPMGWSCLPLRPQRVCNSRHGA